MKGEESVDDVTEADRPALLKDGVCSRSVFMRDRWAWEPALAKVGDLTLCAAVVRSLLSGETGEQAKKGIWWMPWH